MHTIAISVRVCVLSSVFGLAAVPCQALEDAKDDNATFALELGIGSNGSLSRFVLDGSADGGAADDSAGRYVANERGFGFVYRASDDINLYGLRRRAFEAPALSMFSRRPGRDNPGLDFLLRPRVAGDTEIGLKARVGKNLTAGFSAFRSDSEEEFGSRIGPAGLYSARTRREGVEFSLDSRWSSGVGALLSYSLSRTSYTDSYCGHVCSSLGTNFPRSGSLNRWADQVLYGELSWRYPRFGLVTALEAKVVGRGYADDLRSDRTDAYFVANARLGLEQQAGRWRLQEFARIDNIGGRNYFGLSAGDAGLRLVDPSTTRSYSIGISAGYSW